MNMHLVITIRGGWVDYRMGSQIGTHPLGDDLPSQVIAYLVRIIKPTSHEVLYSTSKIIEKRLTASAN
jgi:hypothetical protein